MATLFCEGLMGRKDFSIKRLTHSNAQLVNIQLFNIYMYAKTAILNIIIRAVKQHNIKQ